MSTQYDDPKPYCGNCHSGMNPRPGKGWFCPGCAEYDYNLPTIYSQNVQHPTFERRLKDNPELIVGKHLQRSGYGDETPESLGEIIEYNSDTDEYTIYTDIDEPFDHTERIIEHEVLMDFLHLPGLRNQSPPEGLDRHPQDDSRSTASSGTRGLCLLVI